MELVNYKKDVWGQEVFLGISWDLLWLVLILAFVFIALHALVMTRVMARVMARGEKAKTPSADGPRLVRHVLADRLFHWVLAASVFVLIVTGVFPVMGIKFSWLTVHWIAGLLMTAAVLFHIGRSVFSKDMALMRIEAEDLKEPFDVNKKTGKYSLAQKGIHWAMTLLVLAVIATGLLLFSLMNTPWWERNNWMSEANLGWTFVVHGLSTLGLVGLISLHIYFSLRPEKLFYTRSMLKGWISRDEHNANHVSELWAPQQEQPNLDKND